MLRHESEDVDLVKDPYWWMLRHESETWICQRILHTNMLRHESEDMDLVEDPEIQRC